MGSRRGGRVGVGGRLLPAPPPNPGSPAPLTVAPPLPTGAERKRRRHPRAWLWPRPLRPAPSSDWTASFPAIPAASGALWPNWAPLPAPPPPPWAIRLILSPEELEQDEAPAPPALDWQEWEPRDLPEL